MKTIIAGSRTIHDYDNVLEAVSRSGFEITMVVSGGAFGVDRMGEGYARSHHIPFTVFKPDWNTHGKAAGPYRNRQMVEYADALIAIWDGKSRGTKSTIDLAKKKGIPIYVHIVE
jgi:hypothetical protein